MTLKLPGYLAARPTSVHVQGSRWSAGVGLAQAIAMALLLLPSASSGQERELAWPVISRDKEAVVVELVDPSQLSGQLGQMEADSIAIDRASVRVEYLGPAGDEWQLLLRHPGDSCEGGMSTGSACVIAKPDDGVGKLLRTMLLERISALPEPLWTDPALQTEVQSSSSEAAPAVVRHAHSLPWWSPVENWGAMALWLLLAGALAALLYVPLRQSPPKELLPLAGLVVATFGLRLLFATWGPGDLRQPDDSFLGNWGVPTTYGATVAMLGRLFAWLPIARDRLLVWQSLLLGSLAVVPMWFAARQLTNSRQVAWLAAAALATQPLLIRFSGEANRQGVALFLGTAALWALLCSVRPRRLLHLTLAIVSVALLLGTRPEAFLYVGYLAVLYLLLPVAEDEPPRWRRIGPLLVIGALVALQLFRLAATGELGQGVQTLEATAGVGLSLARFPYVPAVMVHLDSSFTPLAYLVLYVVGCGVALWQRRVWALWAALALMLYSLPLAGVPRGVEGGMQLASARYQTLSLIPFSLVLAFGAHWLTSLLRRLVPAKLPPWALALSGALLLATTLPAILRVTHRTSLDDEYRFLRQAIAQLPPDAELYSAPIGDWGLSPPTFLPASMGRSDIAWKSWPDEWQPSQRPQFLVTQSACSFLLMTPEMEMVDDPATEGGGRRECSLAAEYVVNFAPSPTAQEEIELRSFLRADHSDGRIHLGVYALSEAPVRSLLSR